MMSKLKECDFIMYSGERHGIFPFGNGVGYSTGYELTCEICNTTHNRGLDPETNDSAEGESVCYTNIMGLVIAECCFSKIEQYFWDNRQNIVAWWRKKAVQDQKQAEQDKKLIQEIPIE
jgi:hypothetical protein